ncbi:hypothetical protein VaNZ11_004069, partial [Volvox africanus]
GDMEHNGSRVKVREPDSERILQALAGIQDEYDNDGRWMDSRAAAAWVAKQLSAAEALWEMAGGPSSDYCLVMTGEEDEDFFMTEYSQDLLEACGICNAADDYYKVPATSTPAWRQRVRKALEAALSGLGSARAKELAAQLRQRRQDEQEAERQNREAREAAEAKAAMATSLFAKTKGRKSLDAAGKEAPGRGYVRGRGGRGRNGRSSATAEEDEEAGAGWGRSQQRRRGQGRLSGGKAAREVSESSEKKGSGRWKSSGSESGSESGSHGGTSVGSGSESDDHRAEALVMPNYGTLGSSPSSSSSSDDDDNEEGVDGGDDGGGLKSNGREQRRWGRNSSPRKGGACKAKSRATETEKEKPRADAGQRHRLPEALNDSSNSDGEGRRAASQKRTAGTVATGREESKGVKLKNASAAAAVGRADSDDGGRDGETGADADAIVDARRCALAEIARRRHEQARRLQERVRGTLVPAAA